MARAARGRSSHGDTTWTAGRPRPAWVSARGRSQGLGIIFVRLLKQRRDLESISFYFLEIPK